MSEDNPLEFLLGLFAGIFAPSNDFSPYDNGRVEWDLWDSGRAYVAYRNEPPVPQREIPRNSPVSRAIETTAAGVTDSVATLEGTLTGTPAKDSLSASFIRSLGQPMKDPRPMPPVKATNKAELLTVIDDAARRHGVDPALMKTFAHIESGFDATNQTGSYKGLFQLSDSEFKKYGGGSILNPVDNANAAARKFAAETKQFAAKHGRQPSVGDLYMVHQQGPAGYAAHAANPQGVAWENIAKYYKSPAIARSAIWGNMVQRERDMPGLSKEGSGSVRNVTSKMFLEGWNRKIESVYAAYKPTNVPPDIATPYGSPTGEDKVVKKFADKLPIVSTVRLPTIDLTPMAKALEGVNVDKPTMVQTVKIDPETGNIIQ